MFVGIRAMYQRLKDGKFHLVRPYYRNEVSLIKTALGLGKNIYTNYAFGEERHLRPAYMKII